MGLFSKKEKCALCGSEYKTSELFVQPPDSPLLEGMSGVTVKLCNACNFSFNYLNEERYKKFDVDQAWKMFAASEIMFHSSLNQDIVRNYRKMMSQKLAGYKDYNVFQAAMKELYAKEDSHIVSGYLAVNEGKRCFSIIINEHIGVPENVDNLAEVSLAEEGDEEYVKKCDLVFTYKDPAKKPVSINMFNTQGVARHSTVYKETLETYNQITEAIGL